MATSLSLLLDTFIQEAELFRNLSSRTTHWWRTSYEYFCRFTGICYLEDITEQRIRDFLLFGRTERGWSANTHNTYHRALIPFLKWCVKRGYLKQNPIANIERPRLPQQLPKRISVEEAQLVLDTALNLRYSYHFERYRNHAFLSMLVFTGLRLQEALNVQFYDVDLKQNVVRVRSGKGNKDRLVPICLQLRLSLSRYIQERDRLRRHCPFFFTSLRGDHPLTGSGAMGIIRRVRKVSGVDFSPHRLRHTFATLMLEEGCDLFSLSRMLGHSDINTTTLYLSASVRHLQREIAKHPLNATLYLDERQPQREVCGSSNGL